MAIKCNPPNIPCGGRCIPPDSVCGGKDTPISPENNDRLNKLADAVGSAKPPVPPQKDLDTRSLELERRKLELEKETTGLEDNDITLEQRLRKRNLDREQKSINLEKKERSLQQKEKALRKRNEPDEFNINDLFDAVQESLGVTTEFVDETADTFGLDVIPGITNPAKNTLNFVIERLKRKEQEDG